MPANRPDVADLVVAVREFLQQDLRTLLQSLQAGETQHDAAALKKLALDNAIASNLLRVIERDLALRPAQRQQEHDLLRALLGTDGDVTALNAALIEKIDAGAFDDHPRVLLDVLLQISLAKIAIDNPGYATAQKQRPA